MRYFGRDIRDVQVRDQGKGEARDQAMVICILNNIADDIIIYCTPLYYVISSVTLTAQKGPKTLFAQW